jgi:hypothetical protein
MSICYLDPMTWIALLPVCSIVVVPASCRILAAA